MATTQNIVKVNVPTMTLMALHALIQLPDTLWQGVSAMKELGRFYLPQEVAEQDADYLLRLNRTTLFPGFERTIQQSVGKIFAQAITLGANTAPIISLMASDMDQQGRDISAFAREVFSLAVRHGVSYILVDYPTASGNEETFTLADERALGLRPYALSISLRQVLEIRSAIVKGVERCTMFRFKEVITEIIPDPYLFGTINIEQVRIFRLNPDDETVTYELWRENVDTREWFLFQAPIILPNVDAIPIVPVYTNRTSFFMGTPPLLSLAELNLAHWRQTSDLNHILHFASVPLYFGAGWDPSFDENGIIKPVVISPNSLLLQKDPGAKFEIVEHGGKAIDTLMTHIKEIEDKMAVMGLELTISKPGSQTATQTAIETAEANSILQDMAEQLENALETVMKIMCAYLNVPEESVDGIEVGASFNIDLANSETTDVANLFEGYKLGILSAGDIREELKRRMFLSKNYVVTNDAPVIPVLTHDVTAKETIAIRE